MNKLPTEKRAVILNMLVEGMSMRAVERITGVSLNTITRLLVAAGEACAAYHDKHVRRVKAERLQLDEIWQFCYAKAKQVKAGKLKRAPPEAGDVWTWIGMDADTKLIVSWLLGHRDEDTAMLFCADLRSRVVGRPQITSDGLPAYVDALYATFNRDMDYAQLVKDFEGSECHGMSLRTVEGNPNYDNVNTSFIERYNLTVRMSLRRYTRKTNAFSKRLANQTHTMALHVVHYNFCRIHKSLRMSPAMAAGVTSTLRDMEWVVGLVDARAPVPRKPGPPKGTGGRPRKARATIGAASHQRSNR